jgi:hypothetical protein
VVTNDEPIVLEGDEVMEIVGVRYIHNNDIVLRDQARLIIRDSVFEHLEEYTFQHGLNASGSSQVVLENSDLYTACTGMLNWGFFEQASFIASNVTHTGGCNTWNFFSGSSTADISNWPYFGGTFCDQSRGTITASSDLEVELCWPSGAVVDESLPTTIDRFSFPNDNDEGIDFSLEITDSTIDGWGIGVNPGNDITIRDAEAVTVSVIVGLPWQNETVVLEGLDSKTYEDQTWEIVDATLRFINVTTYGWEPNAFATNTLIIRNSNYSGSTNNSSTATYIIENSTVGAIQTQESVSMTIRDSVITGDVIARNDSTITLIDSIVAGDEDSSLSGVVRATDNATIILINTFVDGEPISDDNGQIILEDDV